MDLKLYKYELSSWYEYFFFLISKSIDLGVFDIETQMSITFKSLSPINYKATVYSVIYISIHDYYNPDQTKKKLLKIYK